MLSLPEPFDKVIVSTSGYTKVSAHYRYRIFLSVTVDNSVLYPVSYTHLDVYKRQVLAVVVTGRILYHNLGLF